MGYQIDSTWKEMRKNDIEELNAIIDDNYCNELEIGRKINLMKNIKKAFNKAVSEINFDTIIKFMTDNNWTWSMYENGISREEVPTKLDIIRSLNRNFLKHALFRIIELNHDRYCSSTGGFVVDIYFMDQYKNEPMVDIYFNIANFDPNNF